MLVPTRDRTFSAAFRLLIGRRRARPRSSLRSSQPDRWHPRRMHDSCEFLPLYESQNLFGCECSLDQSVHRESSRSRAFRISGAGRASSCLHFAEAPQNPPSLPRQQARPAQRRWRRAQIHESPIPISLLACRRTVSWRERRAGSSIAPSFRLPSHRLPLCSPRRTLLTGSHCPQATEAGRLRSDLFVSCNRPDDHRFLRAQWA